MFIYHKQCQIMQQISMKKLKWPTSMISGALCWRRKKNETAQIQSTISLYNRQNFALLAEKCKPYLRLCLMYKNRFIISRNEKFLQRLFRKSLVQVLSWNCCNWNIYHGKFEAATFSQISPSLECAITSTEEEEWQLKSLEKELKSLECVYVITITSTEEEGRQLNI